MPYLVHLHTIGGFNQEDVVHRLLDHVFSNTVAQQLSWMGHKGTDHYTQRSLVAFLLVITHFFKS